MKQLKDFKRYRLLALIFVSTLILSSIGFAGKNTVYADNTIDLLKFPQLMVVFEGIKQGRYPWDVLTQPSKTEEVSKEMEMKKEEVLVTEPVGEEEAAQAEVETESTKEATPSQVQETTPFTKVDESYFDDALFIGDSRTVGLSEYSNWKNPVYYADVGLTVYHVFDKEIANVNGETMNIDQALQRQKFGKIYIMLGINELGRGTTETFATKYSQVIGRIRELQPDAIIFIEGIMGVSKKKSDSDPIFNNKNIQERNAAIESLADNSSVYYIDVNEVIMDASGGIPSEYTFDNVHLKAAYYSIWTNYLMEHGVIRKP
ncbi:GDSL-type esterase/lipase family protein [Lacrimispora sp.]|jgi:hypothetical protein|uniref:GDSL-type esterase/lipase family protein n=1 Tax=Lacrimispora sp. TaxID=2719234 RepID=UPI0028B120B0|nr:GDSL-type esterase/lipase family protein [Lacrimispora sp.]